MKYAIKNDRKYEGTQIIDLITKDKNEFKIKY